jgi:hypothetical protein
MRNQIKKQMKLYTQEQLERAMDLANRNVSKKSIIESLTPIQLPSDEEVGNEASARHYGTNFKHVFASGAKWMRDKIQGEKI